jgi:hypothetical protein
MMEFEDQVGYMAMIGDEDPEVSQLFLHGYDKILTIY